MATRRTLRYITIIVLSLIWIMPLVAIFIFSFAPNQDILRMELLPTRVTLENYNTVLTTSMRGVSIPKSLINSAVIVVIHVIGILILDTPAAYALARVKFFGREVIFALILLTMIPPMTKDLQDPGPSLTRWRQFLLGRRSETYPAGLQDG